MNKTVFLLVLALYAPMIQAQFVKRNAEVLDKPNGEALFMLHDSTATWSVPATEPLWYKVHKRVLFDMADLSTDSTLEAGTVLLNDEFEPIGEVKSSVEVLDILQVEGFRRDKYRSGILVGHISTYDLYTRSRPEEAMEHALATSRGSAGQILAPIFRKYRFEEHQAGQYTAWVLRNRDEENYRNEFPFRILVLTRGTSNVICIVTRHDFIRAEKAKASEENLSGSYTWFQRPTPRITEEVEEIVYRFLPL